MFKAGDYSQRAAHIAAKERQLAACETLLEPLRAVDFAFEELPPPHLEEHLRLLANSAPYTGFCLRIREEEAARVLHQVDRSLRDLRDSPEAAARVALQKEVLLAAVRAERAAETRRMLDLTYEDYVYAWDLGGALSLAEALREDPEYARRVEVLKDAILTDRVKARGIELFRNAGDIGFIAAGVGMASRVTFTFTSGGVTVGLSEAASLGNLSFARYAYGCFNPLTHGPLEVLEESLAEVAGDIAVKLAGPKYEELISRVVELLVERLGGPEAPRNAAADSRLLLEKITARLQGEGARHRRLDPTRAGNGVRGQAVVGAMEDLAKRQERAAAATDPDVRNSLRRQLAAVAAEVARYVQSGVLEAACRRIREALSRGNPDPQQAKQYAESRAAARRRAHPATIERYEALLKDRRADLFDPARGLDIETMRVDFRHLLEVTRAEDQARLRAVMDQIDDVRQERFLGAMTRFLGAHADALRGVILNGTARGNPEYKGLFSDKDFTVVVKDAAHEPRLRQAIQEAFRAEGLHLNSPQAPASADIEVMIQDFLPGDVRRIADERSFLLWAVDLVRDAATRHLSPGGAMWVGQYNFLNASTLTLRGGRAVVDDVPNPDLLPRIRMHPMFAHGLVLDMARFDKLKDPNGLTTPELAELLGARAKYVLRAVDALVWAKAPDLAVRRTPAAAKRLGYHALIVADAKVLAERGLLSPEQFRLVETMADAKRGKLFSDALGLSRVNPEANRAALLAAWHDMTGVMQQAYRGTRETYLHWMEELAENHVRDPRRRELLFTLAFRNFNAARQIGADALLRLTGTVGGDPLRAMQRQDQLIIGLSPDVDALPPPPQPAPHPQQAECPGPHGDPADARPGEVAGDPARHEGVQQLLPFKSADFDTALRPFDEAQKAEMARTIKSTAEFYQAGFKDPIGFVKGVDSYAALEALNEVCASDLARLMGASIPHTEHVRVTVEEDGQTLTTDAAVMRFVPGDSLQAILKGHDVKSGRDIAPPAGYSVAQLLAAAKEQFLRDKLLSALLGDFDRHAGNFVVLPDGQMLSVDHAGAEPFDALGSNTEANRAGVKAEMIRRLTNPDKVSRGVNRYTELNERMGVRFEELAALWTEVLPRLTDAELGRIAGRYGPDAGKVLATWKIRRALMLEVMADLYPRRDGAITALKSAAAKTPPGPRRPAPAPAPSRGASEAPRAVPAPRPTVPPAGRPAPAPARTAARPVPTPPAPTPSRPAAPTPARPARPANPQATRPAAPRPAPTPPGRQARNSFPVVPPNVPPATPTPASTPPAPIAGGLGEARGLTLRGPTGETLEARPGTDLRVGSRLETGPDGAADFRLKDGPLVKLGAGTRLEVRRAADPGGAAGPAQLRMTHGTLRVEGKEGEALSLVTPGVVVTGRGAVYTVTRGADGAWTIAVESGQVTARLALPGAPETPLAPGESLIVVVP